MCVNKELVLHKRKKMIKKIILGIIFTITSSICYSADIGISTSGKDISLSFWSLSKAQSKFGWYARALFDFKTYEKNNIVTICRDGSVSGSSGSGTCSGHGGVSHSEQAEFNRLAVAIGPAFWVSNKIQLHGGILIGFYSSHVNIGNTDALDYRKVGFDFGISFKPIETSNFKIVLSHETEQSRTSLGIRFSI